jgi:hypothetical protein
MCEHFSCQETIDRDFKHEHADELSPHERGSAVCDLPRLDWCLGD